MALIGLLLTFTLPKLLQSVEDNRKEAVLKETFAALNEVLYKGYASGDLYNMPLSSYVQSNMHYQKYCPTGASGCFDPAYPDANITGRPAVTLHNGASIGNLWPWIFNDGTNSNQFIGIKIDYNGLAGPNTDGQDISMLMVCIPRRKDGDTSGCTSDSRPMQLSPYSTYWGYWRNIFK